MEVLPDSGPATTIQQEISVRDHGEMTVYDHQQYDIFPLDPSDTLERRELRLALEFIRDDLLIFEEAELVAVPKDVDVQSEIPGDDQ